MDILTHAGIGMIAAAPLLGSQPELSAGIVAGSVLPDLDALSRVFGKRAFLNWHQTWSHAVPVQAGVSLLAGFLAQGLGIDGILLGAGLFAGMVFHSFLDFTNTLGVTLIAPFSQKRFCGEWVFFIDAFVLALTVLTAGVTAEMFRRLGEVSALVTEVYFLVLVVYIAVKGMWRSRAGRFAPESASLIPSALWPWRFLGVENDKALVRFFQVNAITGRREMLREQEIFDRSYGVRLAEVPEFALMKRLSPAYHVVDVRKTTEGEVVQCRDLRTRNFNTHFGDLEVLLQPEQPVKLIQFHV